MTTPPTESDPRSVGSEPSEPPAQAEQAEQAEQRGPVERSMPAEQSVSQAALERYNRSLRRPRLVYFGVVGTIVVVLVLAFAVAYSRGEVNNTVLHTARAPASLALHSATNNPQQAWRTTDVAAIGEPVWGGTVVVHDAHTVRGVNARSGAQTWSYTRSDRTVCSAAQIDGVTVASYEVGGNCDELTGLDSGTGARLWTRTLDEDGQPLYGHPSYQATNQNGYPSLMITTSSVIYTIDAGNSTTSGGDVWVYSRYGCAIKSAVLGSSGALISQTCTHPQCGTLKFCGRGPQLLLRDASTGYDDTNKTNPDVILWSDMGDTDVPVSAGEMVTALNPTTRQLDTLDPGKGTSLASIRLSPAPNTSASVVAGITADAVSGGELIWIGGISYLVRPDSAKAQWSARTPGPPTVANNSDGSIPIDSARITAPTSSGARTLSGGSGSTTRTYSLSPSPKSGSSVYALGAGFLVTGSSGTAAYA